MTLKIYLELFCVFSGFLVDILLISLMKLQTTIEQMYKFSRGSNKYFSHCLSGSHEIMRVNLKKKIKKITPYIYADSPNLRESEMDENLSPDLVDFYVI